MLNNKPPFLQLFCGFLVGLVYADSAFLWLKLSELWLQALQRASCAGPGQGAFRLLLTSGGLAALPVTHPSGGRPPAPGPLYMASPSLRPNSEGSAEPPPGLETVQQTWEGSSEVGPAWAPLWADPEEQSCRWGSSPHSLGGRGDSPGCRKPPMAAQVLHPLSADTAAGAHGLPHRQAAAAMAATGHLEGAMSLLVGGGR